MAKKCKLIHINDGFPTTLVNGNFHFAEEYDWAAKYLERYLNEGYEVKQMVPEVKPAIQGDGSYSFFKSGFTFYLEREVPADSCSDDEAEAEDPDDILAVIDDDITEEMLADILGDKIDDDLLAASPEASEDAEPNYNQN